MCKERQLRCLFKQMYALYSDLGTIDPLNADRSRQ